MIKSLVSKSYYYAGIALNILSAVAIISLLRFLPPVVPLLYGSAAGESQLVPALGLLIAPIVSFVITVINIWISLTIKDNFSKRALAITSFLLSAITTIAISKIILLVGFF